MKSTEIVILTLSEAKGKDLLFGPAASRITRCRCRR
jgi:hypothetical protein